MEEKKKNNSKGLIIALGLLIIVILGLITYICYDKGMFSISNDTSNKGINEKLSTEKEEISKVLSYDEGNMLIEKIKVINDNFNSLYPIEKVSNISNQDLLTFAAKKLGFGEKFTEENANNIISTYFGNSVKLAHENIICEVDKLPFYTYDSNSKSYMYDSSSHAHGMPLGVSTETFYVDGKYISDKKIVINAKVLYSNYCGDTCMYYGYYTSYKDSINKQNPVIGGDENTPVDFNDALYKSVENKIPITTYTFIKNDSNVYSLESVKTN